MPGGSFEPVVAVLLFSCTLALHARQVDIKLRLDYLWAAQARPAFCVLGGGAPGVPAVGGTVRGALGGRGRGEGSARSLAGPVGEPCPRSVWQVYERRVPIPGGVPAGGDGAEGLSVPWLDRQRVQWVMGSLERADPHAVAEAG